MLRRSNSNMVRRTAKVGGRETMIGTVYISAEDVNEIADRIYCEMWWVSEEIWDELAVYQQGINLVIEPPEFTQ